MKPFIWALVVAYACTLGAWAQAQGSGGSPGASSAAPSASQGSATIENQMISYQAMAHIADQIAADVRSTCTCAHVLLFDPNAQLEIITAKAFDVSAEALIKAYNGPAPRTGIALIPTLDIGSFLTAIKSSATYSNQNFTPTPQSMITLLNISFKGNPAIHTSASPGDLDKATDYISKELGEIQNARNRAQAKITGTVASDNNSEQLSNPDQHTDSTSAGEAKARAKADGAALADLDKEFSALRTSLTATSPDGTVLATIVKGRALLLSLKDPWSVLTVSVDAAGGDTRIRHLFWQELVMPTPTPWYNGGAAVSMLLTDKNGGYQIGHMYHYMYDFSKWKNSKLDPFPNDPK